MEVVAPQAPLGSATFKQKVPRNDACDDAHETRDTARDYDRRRVMRLEDCIRASQGGQDLCAQLDSPSRHKSPPKSIHPSRQRLPHLRHRSQGDFESEFCASEGMSEHQSGIEHATVLGIGPLAQGAQDGRSLPCQERNCLVDGDFVHRGDLPSLRLVVFFLEHAPDLLLIDRILPGAKFHHPGQSPCTLSGRLAVREHEVHGEVAQRAAGVSA